MWSGISRISWYPEILDNYKQKQTFSSSTRTDLVNLIVDGIMNMYALISSAMANNIFEEIVKLFPVESKVVYFSSRMLNEKHSGAKLIDRYRIVKKKYWKKKNSYPEPTIDYEYQDEEDKYKMIWLHISYEPWYTLKSYWFDTYEQRINDVSIQDLLPSS